MKTKKKVSQETKVQNTLDAILKAFESGDISKAIKQTVITKKIEGIPSHNWSFLNQIIMNLIGGTYDARGFRQWKEVGKNVKKGSESFSILGPKFTSKTEINETTNQEEEKKILRGFFPIPVFSIDDTEGAELPEYQTLAPDELPPLYDVAKKFGLEIAYIPNQAGYYGYYCDSKDFIGLCTHDQAVFYHELAHAAHFRVIPNEIKNQKKWQKEIVAELSAAVMANMNGLKWESNSFKYIERYVEEEKSKKSGESASSQDVHKACISVLSDVKKVLDLIYTTKEETETVEA